MKARTFLRFIFLMGIFLSFTNVNAQVPAGFKVHGFDSGDVDHSADSEGTDSVTVGASIRYFVAPDAILNPNYNVGGGWVLSTSFTWDEGTLGVISGAPDTDNDITITMSGSALADTLRVIESSGASCDGAEVKIPVRVIAAPTADFNAATNSICQADIADYDVDVNLATSTVGGNIRYAIQMDGPSTTNIYSATINVNGTTDTFTVPAAEFDDGLGNYVITFTEISDHISRKSVVNGLSPTQASHTLTINRTPSTGGIYHLPNM